LTNGRKSLGENHQWDLVLRQGRGKRGEERRWKEGGGGGEEGEKGKDWGGGMRWAGGEAVGGGGEVGGLQDKGGDNPRSARNYQNRGKGGLRKKQTQNKIIYLSTAWTAK